jgi:hypothetical protein
LYFGLNIDSPSMGYVSGQTLDISEHGLSATLPVELPIGEIVELDLTLRARVLTMFATVLLVLGIASNSSAQTEFLPSHNQRPTIQDYGRSRGDSGPFNRIWHHALNRFNMADEVGEGGAVLANGTLLTVGLSGNLPNHCPGYFGGGLAFDLTVSGGNIKWEKLVSRDCTSDDQWFTGAAATRMVALRFPARISTQRAAPHAPGFSKSIVPEIRSCRKNWWATLIPV